MVASLLSPVNENFAFRFVLILLGVVDYTCCKSNNKRELHNSMQFVGIFRMFRKSFVVFPLFGADDISDVLWLLYNNLPILANITIIL